MELDALRSQPGAAQPEAELAVACGCLRAAREEGIGGIDARLRLRGARGRAPSQPRELTAGEVLAGLLGRRGLRLAFGARREVRRVPGSAGPFMGNVEVRRAAVDLEHLVRDAVEHVPVVGHEEQARPGTRPAIPRGTRSRRGRGGWSARRGPARPTRARAARRARHASSAHPTARRSTRRARRPCPGARASLRPATPAPSRPSHTADAHGARRQHRELGQRADPGVAAAPHDAGLGFAVAAHHREQRALTAAVETDDADAVAVAEGQREIGEQRPVRAGCPQALAHRSGSRLRLRRRPAPQRSGAGRPRPGRTVRAGCCRGARRGDRADVASADADNSDDDQRRFASPIRI